MANNSFDPSEFDSRPSDPGNDYMALLDAMREAGAKGVQQQVAVLVAKIDADAAKREDWLKQVQGGLRDLHTTADRLAMTSNRMWWDRLKEWLSVGLIAVGLLVAAVIGTRWASTPVTIHKPYGCTGRWIAKTQTCKGKWVTLDYSS